MTLRPRFKLSRLREIAWRQWDPIGLYGLENTPDDEYDSYVLQAVGRLWDGATEDEVTDFLIGIEADYMGLGHRDGIKERARGVVRALGGYVAEFRS
jgi:hypothetical protein